MNFKKWLIGGVAAFVAMFILSFLWFGLIMVDFYGEHYAGVSSGEVDFVWLTLGYLFYAFCMAYVYPMGYGGGAGAKEGMRFGLFAGLLIWLGPTFINLGAYDLTVTVAIVDVIYHAIEAMIGGTIIGMLYGGGEAVAAEVVEAPPAPTPEPVTPSSAPETPDNTL